MNLILSYEGGAFGDPNSSNEARDFIQGFREHTSICKRKRKMSNIEQEEKATYEKKVLVLLIDAKGLTSNHSCVVTDAVNLSKAQKRALFGSTPESRFRVGIPGCRENGFDVHQSIWIAINEEEINLFTTSEHCLMALAFN